MRTATAYFAGVGTVVVAIAAGVGGGLTIANIVSPHDAKQEISKVERRNSSEPIPAAPSEPVSYLAATQAAATKPVVVSPAPQQQNAAPSESAKAAPPAEATTARDNTNNAIAQQPPQANAPQPAPSTQAAAREQTASPEDANAKARDVDAKAVDAKAREGDMKRAAAEKRRTERRQQWAERRRQPRHQDDDLRDVELKVREATEAPRVLAADPVQMEGPRIRLFDTE